MTFRFDPSRGVSPSEIAVVERDIATQRTKLEQEVAAGLSRLRAVVASHATRRQALEGRAAELRPQYAQALADAAVVPEDRTTHKRLLALSGVAAALAIGTGLGGPSSTPRYNQPPVMATRQAAPVALPAPLPPPPAPASPVQIARTVPIDRAPQLTGVPSSTPSWRTEPVETPPPMAGPPVPQISNPASARTRLGDAIEHVVMKQAGYVRAGSNGTAVVVRTAPSGARLRVFSRSSGWIQVGEEEPWGWVYSGLVDAAP